jgi:selenophosphate synthase
MARGSEVTIEIAAARVPLIKGALELATQGLLTSGDKSNRRYVGDDIEIGDEVTPPLASLLFDPQTAGGLLISLPAARAENCWRACETFTRTPPSSVASRSAARMPSSSDDTHGRTLRVGCARLR